MHHRHLPMTLALLAGLLSFAGAAVAQTAPSHQAATAAKAPNTTASKPLWTELSPDQRLALEPLARLWPSMTEAHKRKWLALSRNFNQLSMDEKSTLQGRMHEWAALTPQQRTLARLNFADIKQLPQDERRAKWEAYQALSPEEKQKLASQQPKPLVGAAPAIKPTPSQKLVTPPPASTAKALPRIDTEQLTPSTLLPTPAVSAAPAPTPTTAPSVSDSPSAQ
jgi:hypothetical protein